MRLDLVVWGNLAVDDVVVAEGDGGGRARFGQAGGAALYAALAARLWGLEVGMVAPVGDGYPPETLVALGERGVRLEGVRPMGGPGLRTWLLYESGLRRVVHRLDGPTHAAASPALGDLPQAWRARAWHLAPLPLPLQASLAAAAAERDLELVAADPYELLESSPSPAWRALLAAVDLFLVSEDELADAEIRAAPRAFLERFASTGPAEVMLKRGERGGLALDTATGRWREWAPRAERVVDTTGAGDAFAAGVLAGWLRGDSRQRSAERGVVSASFAIEAEGALGLLAATSEAAAARLERWYG